MILSRPLLMFMALNVVSGILVSQPTVPFVVVRPSTPGLCRRCKQPGHVARECGQTGGQPRPSSSAPVPDNSVPVPATGSRDDGDLSSVSSDHPAPSYMSLTVDDIPRRPRTKHTKRLSTQSTTFPFSAPKLPVIPRSKSVSFRK